MAKIIDEVENLIEQYQAEIIEKYSTLEGFKEFIKGKGAYLLDIFATDGIHSRKVTIGTDPTGTDGYNPDFDGYAPPAPPAPTIDLRIVGTNDKGQPEEYLKDIRNSNEPLHIFTLKYATGNTGNFILNWNPEDLSGVTKAILSDANNTFSVDMKEVDSFDTNASASTATKCEITIEQ